MANVATVTITDIGLNTKSAERAYIATALERVIAQLHDPANAGGNTFAINTSFAANSGSCVFNSSATLPG